jgi:arylsulfatase
LLAALLAGLALCAVFPVWSRLGRPAPVVYDLAARTAVAERVAAREVVYPGVPGYEHYFVEGFHSEGRRAPGATPFLWSKRECELAFDWPATIARAGVLDLAPYPGVAGGQRVELLLNGQHVAEFALNDARARYRLELPASAQVPGRNRLRLRFAAAAAPTANDPASTDDRELAAAFHALTLAQADDASLDDLLHRDAPAPVEWGQERGVPTLTMWAPGSVRFALRLPAGAELRFTPELHALARSAAGSATFRVTLESAGRPERELFAQRVQAGDRDVQEVALRLPGRAGDVVRLGLHAQAAPAQRFAWGVWRAPRVLGCGPAVGLRPQPWSAADAARGSAQQRRLSAARPNVIFMILDAARAQQFGTYGYERATTPHIDRLAREGVVFEHAVTPAVYTLSAMSSVWTSLYPDRHHGDLAFSSPLPDESFTLAELLSARGVTTAAFVANAMAGRAFGLHQGFGEFREIFRDLGSDADAFMQVVPGWTLQHRDQPFFLYLHFREPHFPYDPRAPFDTAFGPDGPLAKEQRRDANLLIDVNQGRRPFSAEERAHLVRLYDGNLAFVDEQVGRLRAALEAQGVWERSVVIIAGDHGEALLEHGYIGHNTQLYEASVRVPLIVRFPRGLGPAGQRVPALVDLLDIAPTVADVFGLGDQADARRHFQGRSLLGVLAGAPGKPAVLSRTVWERPRYGLSDGRYKYIYDTRTGEEELYDTHADRGETRNLKTGEPLRAAFYRQELFEWIAANAQGADEHAAGRAASKLTREQCENLKSLGYLGADVVCPAQ